MVFANSHLVLLSQKVAREARPDSGKGRDSDISRWGLIWISERQTTVNRDLRGYVEGQDAIRWDDPRGQKGWGLVSWPAELMKTRIDFWLPIPPFGLHILRSAMRDWRALVNKSHGFRSETKWV